MLTATWPTRVILFTAVAVILTDWTERQDMFVRVKNRKGLALATAVAGALIATGVTQAVPRAAAPPRGGRPRGGGGTPPP
ncbi:hypothetical protein ACWEFL_25640, partial [Streptomyces sp. NPDC004838]